MWLRLASLSQTPGALHIPERVLEMSFGNPFVFAHRAKLRVGCLTPEFQIFSWNDAQKNIVADRPIRIHVGLDVQSVRVKVRRVRTMIRVGRGLQQRALDEIDLYFPEKLSEMLGNDRCRRRDGWKLALQAGRGSDTTQGSGELLRWEFKNCGRRAHGHEPSVASHKVAKPDSQEFVAAHPDRWRGTGTVKAEEWRELISG